MTPAMLAKAVGMPLGRAALWAPLIVLAWIEFGIVDKADKAMFLAQCGHESASFKALREKWGPTAQQKRYERDQSAPWPKNAAQAKLPGFAVNRLAYRLGNDLPGDGRRYAGRGPIQLTGKTNYLSCGIALGIDLVNAPELAELPHAGVRVAGWYWLTRGLSKLSGDVVEATHVINGGETGLPDRTERLERALAIDYVA